METDTHLWIEQLRKREKDAFGERIKLGGDMYWNHKNFIKCASSYDNGDLYIRSKVKHEEWQRLLICKLLLLEGSDSLKDNYDKIKNYI